MSPFRAVVGIFLGLATGVGIYLLVNRNPAYSAQATVVLVSPDFGSLTPNACPKVVSPYHCASLLPYPDSLTGMSALIADAESTQATAQRLSAEGVPENSYSVVPDPLGEPGLDITATASTPEQALRWDRIVALDVAKYITNAQRGAPRSTRVTPRLILPTKVRST
jgi:hypothetical protein